MGWVFCCLQDLFEDKVAYVEPSYLHPLVLVSGYFSLVLPHLFHSFVSYFVDQIHVAVEFLQVPLFFIGFDRMLVNPTSIGMMASIPNVNQNGVSPVGTLVVVLYAHRTLALLEVITKAKAIFSNLR